MFWGYVSTENCRSKNMQFLVNRCFSWGKNDFWCSRPAPKKSTLDFLGQLCCPRNYTKISENTQFFGLKHDAKQRRHPKSIKNTPGGAPQGFLFGHKSIFYRFWAAWREPPNLPLAQNVAWQLQKRESSISSRGHPGYLRCGFPSKITFWVVFTAPQGVQTPLQDAFWHLKVLKAEGL